MTGIQLVFFALMMLLSAGMIIGLVAVKPSALVSLVVLAVGYPALFYGAGYLVEKVSHILNRHGHL
jgi:hypothetical protein